jgi:uncharacterized protein (TIGR03000 family)
MMATRWFWSTAALSLAAAGLLFVPAAQAQHGGGHGSGHPGGGGGHPGGGGGHAGYAHPGGYAQAGGYYGGRGYSGWGGGYRYGGWDRGRGYYPGVAFGLGYGLGYGSRYGYGYGGYYPNYGYSSYPDYGYGYGGDDSSPGYYSYAPPVTDYQSFYPPDTSSAPPASPPGGTNGTDAVVRVRVPDPNAQVWFEGTPTQQRGTDREFESPPLQPDRTYHYDVRARWTENGRTFDETRTVAVHAGDRVTVDFMPRSDEGADNGRSR